MLTQQLSSLVMFSRPREGGASPQSWCLQLLQTFLVLKELGSCRFKKNGGQLNLAKAKPTSTSEPGTSHKLPEPVTAVCQTGHHSDIAGMEEDNSLETMM